jgi:mRNA interferase MazF
MPGFRQGDVVKVPFPYTDRPVRHHRPALVVGGKGLETAHGLLWVSMITSAENRAWPGDVPVTNLAVSGLPVPSVVRPAKIATIDVSDAIRIGKLSASSLKKVIGHICREIGCS